MDFNTLGQFGTKRIGKTIELIGKGSDASEI